MTASIIKNAGLALGLSAGLLASVANADVLGNWNWLKDSVYAGFTDEDWAQLKDATRTLLDDGEPGAVQAWSNPATGASGKVRVGSYKDEDGTTCRWTEFYTEVGDQKSGHNWYYLCQNDEGHWKVAKMR